MIRVVRVGFYVVDSKGYDGPEDALAATLQRMERQGATIVSTSVLLSHRGAERYEAFITFRDDEPDHGDTGSDC